MASPRAMICRVAPLKPSLGLQAQSSHHADLITLSLQGQYSFLKARLRFLLMCRLSDIGPQTTPNHPRGQFCHHIQGTAISKILVATTSGTFYRLACSACTNATEAHTA